MLSWPLLILLIHTFSAAELPREDALSWVRGRLLEGLGLQEPPLGPMWAHSVDLEQHDQVGRGRQRGLAAWRNRETGPQQETAQMILFPSSDSSCVRPDSAPGEITQTLLTFHFQASISSKEVLISAEFWFFSGDASSPLFILSPVQQDPLLTAEAPYKKSSDGWTTYRLGEPALDLLARGPVHLQVHCSSCQCSLTNRTDQMPFLDLRAGPRSPRSRRHAALDIPWSPFAIDLLQRPSQERPEQSDCQRAQVDISFQELGWDNWIVQPAVLTFYYCHGNCSARDRSAAALGITQCCAPMPGSMRSLKVTTTSDGGHSFKVETLPNIIPEECVCI